MQKEKKEIVMPLRVSVMVMVLMCAVLPPGVWSEDRALLVGVGKYQMPNNDLPGIDADISSMKDVAERLGFRPSQVKVLLDEQATLDNIVNAMNDWLIKGVTPADRVLFYFSGHGSRIADRNGDEPDVMDEVLMTHDTGFHGPYMIRCLVDDDLGVLLDRIPARMVMVFIDACHSGTVTRTMEINTGERSQEKYYTKFFHYPGIPEKPVGSRTVSKAALDPSERFIAVSAAQDDERALCNPRGSLFTRGLVSTIRDGSKNGNITMQDIKDKTTLYIAGQIKNPKKVHRPHLSGNTVLASVNLFSKDIIPVPTTQPATVAATPPPKPAPSQTPPAAPPISVPSPPAAAPQPVQTASLPAENKKDALWSDLETIAKRAAYQVAVDSDRRQYKVGDLLRINVHVPRNGYVNVLHVTEGEDRATVLYPNKYNPDNTVSGSGKIHIPAPGDAFELKAQPPLGRSLVVVLHTREPVNYYRLGGVLDGRLFQTVSRQMVRSLPVGEGKKNKDYGAGALVLVVDK
jgi:metacaspase-1